MDFERELKDNIRRTELEKKRREAEQKLKEMHRVENNIHEAKLLSEKYVTPFLQSLNNIELEGKGKIIQPHVVYEEHDVCHEVSSTELRLNTTGTKYFSLNVQIDPKYEEVSWPNTSPLKTTDADYDKKMINILNKIVNTGIGWHIKTVEEYS